jgi:hypothetical protein
MKSLLLVVLVGSSISFALPVYAQQTNAPHNNYVRSLSRSLKKFTMRLTTAVPPHLARDTRMTGLW